MAKTAGYDYGVAKKAQTVIAKMLHYRDTDIISRFSPYEEFNAVLDHIESDPARRSGKSVINFVHGSAFVGNEEYLWGNILDTIFRIPNHEAVLVLGSGNNRENFVSLQSVDDGFLADLSFRIMSMHIHRYSTGGTLNGP